LRYITVAEAGNGKIEEKEVLISWLFSKLLPTKYSPCPYI
jgi:hypothetical protein